MIKALIICQRFVILMEPDNLASAGRGAHGTGCKRK